MGRTQNTSGITKKDARELIRGVRAGEVTPEQFPGKPYQAFRLLIRSIRARYAD